MVGNNKPVFFLRDSYRFPNDYFAERFAAPPDLSA
jgi:catalase